jgi:hypothetical protein
VLFLAIKKPIMYKYLLPVCVLLSACGNTSTEEKIKDSLTQFHSTGLDAGKHQRIDSIVVLKVDKYTEKQAINNRIKEAISAIESYHYGYEEAVAQAKDDSAEIDSYHRNHMEVPAYKENAYQKDLTRAENYLKYTARDQKEKDSLDKAAKNADAQKFAYYYVQYKIYFSGDIITNDVEMNEYLDPQFKVLQNVNIISDILNQPEPGKK